VKQQIDEFLEALPQMTEEEVNFIEEVLNWSSETKSAFKIAKRIVDEEDLN
jgi:hypothetical protein